MVAPAGPIHARPLDPFRLPRCAARTQAAPGRRRLSQSGAALRPDERPDVGRPAPRLERRAHLQAAPAPEQPPVPAARRGGRHPRPPPAHHRRGRERTRSARLGECIEFIQANAEALPFAAGRFDAVTIAFGIRNVPRIETALAEMQRVLKPGGCFLCLEFSSVAVPGLDALYELYSFKVIPEIGRLVAGDAAAYQYLAESIRRFPRPDAFAQLMRTAGFGRVAWNPLTGGIVAIHSGWRL